MIEQQVAANMPKAKVAQWLGLWRHSNFLKVWTSHTLSLFGSEITNLALPLTAALLLEASAFQMALLAAMGQAAFLLFSLPTGIWIDRVRRRPVLIVCDCARALFLASVPIAAAMQLLSMELLYLVAFSTGIFNMIFEVAHYAYIPNLVGKEKLVDANSRLQMSYSFAESGGPVAGGLLVQLLSAPLALLADVFSFIVSAICLANIRQVEQPRLLARPSAQKLSLTDEIQAGLKILLGHPLLKPIILSSMLSNLFYGAISALYILYATRILALTPLQIGIVFAVGGVAAIAGAFSAKWVANRYGIGPSILGGWLIDGASLLLLPFASVSNAMIILLIAQFLRSSSGTLANIHQWSLRQKVTPDHLQGRVMASHRFLVYGSAAIGALGGGLVAESIGLRWAMLFFAVGVLVAYGWAICSPLRHFYHFDSNLSHP